MVDLLRDIGISLSSLSHIGLILALFLAGTTIAVVENWKLCMWALLAQYVVAGVLLVSVIPLPVAVVKVVVGAMVCVILYVTARRVHSVREAVEQEETDEAPHALWDIFSMSLGFRFLAALLVAVLSYALASRYPSLDQLEGVAQACYWLGSIGLLTVIVARDPLKLGVGLLTFQAGFEVLFAALENSLSVAALLGVVNLLIALVVSYLATAQVALFMEEHRR